MKSNKSNENIDEKVNIDFFRKTIEKLEEETRNIEPKIYKKVEIKEIPKPKLIKLEANKETKVIKTQAKHIPNIKIKDTKKASNEIKEIKHDHHKEDLKIEGQIEKDAEDNKLKLADFWSKGSLNFKIKKDKEVHTKFIKNHYPKRELTKKHDEETANFPKVPDFFQIPSFLDLDANKIRDIREPSLYSISHPDINNAKPEITLQVRKKLASELDIPIRPQSKKQEQDKKPKVKNIKENNKIFTKEIEPHELKEIKDEKIFELPSLGEKDKTKYIREIKTEEEIKEEKVKTKSIFPKSKFFKVEDFQQLKNNLYHIRNFSEKNIQSLTRELNNKKESQQIENQKLEEKAMQISANIKKINKEILAAA